MQEIEIIQKEITEIEVECIVNAANSRLLPGGGVCGAIFRKAGYEALQKACEEIGECKTGEAVITPGFLLKAKYIIHAVGPIYKDGKSGEAEQLKSCYKNALVLAKSKGLRSIAFPVISSGIYGYPKQQAWEEAVFAVMEFMEQNPGIEMKVVFSVIENEMEKIGRGVLLKARKTL